MAAVLHLASIGMAGGNCTSARNSFRSFICLPRPGMEGMTRARLGRVEGEGRMALLSARKTCVVGWMRARLSVFEFTEAILNWRVVVMSLMSKTAPG